MCQQIQSFNIAYKKKKNERPQQEVKCTQCETRLTFDTDQQLRPLFHGIDSLHAQQRMRHLLTRALVAYRTFASCIGIYEFSIFTQKNHWPIFYSYLEFESYTAAV